MIEHTFSIRLLFSDLSLNAHYVANCPPFCPSGLGSVLLALDNGLIFSICWRKELITISLDHLNLCKTMTNDVWKYVFTLNTLNFIPAPVLAPLRVETFPTWRKWCHLNMCLSSVTGEYTCKMVRSDALVWFNVNLFSAYIWKDSLRLSDASKSNPEQWTWVGTFNLLLMLKMQASWCAVIKKEKSRTWDYLKQMLSDLWNGTFKVVYLGGFHIQFHHIRKEADSWCLQKSAAREIKSNVSEPHWRFFFSWLDLLRHFQLWTTVSWSSDIASVFLCEPQVSAAGSSSCTNSRVILFSYFPLPAVVICALRHHLHHSFSDRKCRRTWNWFNFLFQPPVARKDMFLQ